MSFQGYLKSIEAKTGMSAEQLLDWGRSKGLADDSGLTGDIKVGAILAQIKQEFGLGHGHAMAIVALLKGKRD